MFLCDLVTVSLLNVLVTIKRFVLEPIGFACVTRPPARTHPTFKFTLDLIFFYNITIIIIFIRVYILCKNKKYPLFLPKSQRMHFSISVNVPFERHRRAICKKNCHQLSSDMRVIPTRPVFSKSDNKLVLRKS